MAGSRRCVSARQLGLLLWKNSILKRRSYLGKAVPVFLVIEILWPILLFAILAGMKSIFPPVDMQATVYRPFALPSAGALPFLQSAMCDFSNQLQNNYTDMPLYPNASVNQFYSLLERAEVFQNWNEVCSNLESQLACFTAEGRLLACQEEDPIRLNCTLRDPDSFADFLSHDLGLSTETTTAILHAQFYQSDLFDTGRFQRQVPSLPPIPPILPGDFLAQILGDELNGAALRELVCSSTDILELVVDLENIEMVKGELCDLSDSQFQLLADTLRDQMLNNCSVESLTDQAEAVQSLNHLQGFVAVQQELADSLPSFSNESDRFDDLQIFLCGSNGSSSGLTDLFDRLTRGNDYQQAQQEAQAGSGSGSGEDHLLSPKILFTPNTSCVRSIIQRTNRTFAVAGILAEWANSVATCTAYLLQNDTRSAIITAVNEFVDANISLPEVSKEDLLDAQYSMNESNPDNIWNIIQDVNDVAEQVEAGIRVIDWDILIPVATEDEMVEQAEDYTWQEENQVTVVAGLVFDDIPGGEGEGEGEGACPGMLQPKVYIRMNSTAVHDTTVFRSKVWRPGPEDGRDHAIRDQWKRVYLDYGFIFIQDMVERAVVEEIVASSGNVSNETRIALPGSYVEQMPYPCYQDDRFMGSMLFVLPLAMIFAWLFPIAMTIRGIVREKETRLREFMKMMGLSDAVLRTSWFLTSGVILFASVIGITLLLKIGLILPFSDWLLIMIYLLLYAISMIAYSFLVSVFFTNPNLAACVGCLLYFLVFFVHISLLPRQYLMPSFVLVLVSLWAPMAYGLGASYIVQYEMQQLGLQWSNVAMTAIPDDALSVQTIMGMLVVDTILYMVLVWYIEGVWPGRYGVAKPLYFPFQPSYWLGQKTWLSWSKHLRRGVRTLDIDLEAVELLDKAEGEDGEEREGEGGEEGEVTTKKFEEEPSHLPLGIAISHLSKTYSSGLPCRRKKVKAVRDLSLNFYEGQITAFLGHNGAGKTTTMSVLTGLYEPSAGTARVYGNDIRSHMDEIRHSLGLCPQHNILFDLLTVREHLLFYGMMRGLSYSHLRSTIPSWLTKVGLSPHADKMSLHLSGGMKRKLSVLLAFVGESRTIILDEPTAGVDPFARRQIWDFLLRHRDNRTVMLSTHHMDEAELLGDRIAILSQGSLICCGSFEFLRHNYGRGHQLSLVTHHHSTLPSLLTASQPTPSLQGEDETDEARPVPQPLDNTVLIGQLIQNLIPSARLEEHRGREMRFLLPLHQARPHTLTLLFSRLETLAKEMGVASYGLTACSMEEIFIHLTRKEAAEASRDDAADATVPRPSLHSTMSLDDTISVDSSERLVTEQVAMETEKDDEMEEDVDSVFQLCPDDTDGGGYGNEGYQGRRLTGLALWLTQAQGLLVKRAIYTYRRLLAYSVQILLPLALIVLGLLIARELQTVPNQPPLELTPSLFFTVNTENYIFVGGCNDTEPWTYTPDFAIPSSYFDYLQNATNFTINPNIFPLSLQSLSENANFTNPLELISPASYDYVRTLYRPCGVSTSSLESNTCSANESISEPCFGEPQLTCRLPCGGACVDGSSQFPSEPPTCFSGSQTGTKIQDLTSLCGEDTGVDSEEREEAYQALVAYLLGTKPDYIESRYGGISFGHLRSEVNESLDARNLVEGADWPFMATRQAAKAWYSFKGFHAIPAYVNTLSNAILRANMPEHLSKVAGVRTYSLPFKYSQLKRLFYIVTERGTFLINPLATIFNLGFIAASFLLFLIEERSGKTFHLQLVCGVSRVVYWITTALWDLCVYLLFTVVVLLLYVAFQDEFYSHLDVLPTILLLFISYGVAITPWMYALSFPFRSPATAYIVLFCLNFFSGFSLLIIDAIIVYLKDNAVSSSIFIPELLIFPFPSYAMARSLMYISLDRPLKRVLSSYLNISLPHPMADLWPFVLSLWIQAAVYVAIVVFIQFRPNFLQRLCSRPLTVPVVACDDENVRREEGKVKEGGTKRDILTLKDLTKVYDRSSCRGKMRVAVNRLNLSMKPSECFGLLGVNGAGKTTTFRMLTGDTGSSCGDALIHGRSVKNRDVIQRAVGYCPQVDALTDQLSGRQHLTLYAQLRGIPRSEVAGVVNWAIQRLGLTPHADKPAGQYSGGNRRRLSAAISLLGAPQLLLLDEPTSGVDPAARQFLWSIIRGVASAGQSVLLTTHSMAECEALCSRVGIMVNGTFRCLGTPQQLKSRYGDGYRLKLRVSGPLEPIQEFIRQNFPSSVLKEHHLNTLVYQLPPTGLKLSEAFRDLERGRETLEIRDYSLSQTTLDDVFIHFASQQTEDTALHEEEEEEEGEGTRLHDPLPDVVAHSHRGARYTVLKDDVTII